MGTGRLHRIAPGAIGSGVRTRRLRASTRRPASTVQSRSPQLGHQGRTRRQERARRIDAIRAHVQRVITHSIERGQRTRHPANLARGRRTGRHQTERRTRSRRDAADPAKFPGFSMASGQRGIHAQCPEDTSTHRRILGETVEFDHEFTGIVFFAADLDAANQLSDELLRPYARQFLDSLPASETSDTLSRTKELIEVLLPTGRCSVEQVARSLGFDRRTLHRHLAESGDTFTAVLNSVRSTLAERLSPTLATR